MSDFEIKNRREKVDKCYGIETFHITEEEIAALLSGKKLYSTINDGEYAMTIEMKGKEAITKTAEIWGLLEAIREIQEAINKRAKELKKIIESEKT